MKKKTGIAIALAVLIAAGGAGGWMYHNAQIDKMRTAGIEAMKASVNLDNYRDGQKEEIEKIFADSEEKINQATDQETVDKIGQEASAQISEIKTDAQLDVEEGIKKLKSSVNLDDYRDEQKKEVQTILDDTEKAIKEAAGDKEIGKLIEEAGSKISEIKTDEQMTAEEQAAAAARRAASKKSSKKKKNSGGCVSNDASNFY